MSRHHFLGSTDLAITTSLLTNYNVPTKIPDGFKLNKIKHQDDLVLIELGTLLTSNECDEILANINEETFESMFDKYDVRKRNNSRLIVMDDRLARTLWRRLKFSNKLTKLVQNTKPLGFNVQGNWELSGVNPAMRLNKYNEGEYFSPHKDAQYAPSGDERSLFSLVIYLTDNYEKGETKFYFPKISPKSNIRGLTIKEEIDAHGGLENGYECVILQPKKGYAVLFTHNLLHEAIAPEIANHVGMTQRLILRTDVLVKRKEKLLGFAVCPEEEDDYFACLNFFREAQQNELKEYHNYGMFINTINTGELYERSLSIRYCYPHLLESIIKQDEVNSLIEQLPSEMWLHIFKFLHEQDIQNLIFAYPKFQLLKMIWQAQETKQLETDPSQPKFIPTIHAQYGSRTLFCFSDADFFYRHINACCRVVAVYAFFLLGHGKDSKTYTIRYDRNTQQACEVKMEKILADAFYNRNCYGSLYRVTQKDENKRQPMVDLDYSVDRTYMSNRHQSQFIGQDLLSRLHIKIEEPSSFNSNLDIEMDYYGHLNVDEILAYQRRMALYDSDEKLVNEYMNDNEDEESWVPCKRDYVLGYHEHLMKQTEQNSGTSLLRMLSAKDHLINSPCACPLSHCALSKIHDLILVYNHLIFDFDTHQLTVERLSDEIIPYVSFHSLLHNCIETLRNSASRKHPISYHRVNIEKLAKEIGGFNHASCNCVYPTVKVDQFSFLDYTYLSHVHLTVAEDTDHVFVLATYGGIAAL
ncbi:unnamed protein product [Rotaria sp. Silwood2]|nr:unnamed protein product [Rotaria sp. Silwood2]CAF3011891.1 unnamed protein product [Rotaria sp. Silwood2]CAF3277806.1 unnamed protein product [Rotaria sp. Silwood2]CAF3364848.1 unnamed protein product [Rotaria sp. Silwood2]CAF4131670.1 unnamed protein product [Rotaria sp. Silwood2]